MKRGGNLLIPYAAVSKSQQEQIEAVNEWPEYTPEDPEALNDEISQWAIKFCKRMRDIHDLHEDTVDDYMPSELTKKSTIMKNGQVTNSSSDDEDAEGPPSENNVPTEEEDNDYIADYFDEEADAFGNE
eukprot:NODE_63_length_25098_cov_0.440498.p16 type:complete len:129 gc:universal NODE_63_length_25098_cov_0.440498:19910-20296(+)